MKLNYDRKSKDPTYFIQMGIRNGKKTTTKNVARIGKHSELLKITDDPLAYAKEQVRKYNEEYKKENKVSLEIKVDFAEKIKATNAISSNSTLYRYRWRLLLFFFCCLFFGYSDFCVDCSTFRCFYFLYFSCIFFICLWFLLYMLL